MLCRRAVQPLFAKRCIPVVQTANFTPRKPSEMPRDIINTALDYLPKSAVQTSQPQYDRDGTYVPQFYETIEMYVDNVIANRLRLDYPNGFLSNWNCTKDQGELVHWRRSADKHGVTRIQMFSSDNNYPCHIEIHWDHWFLLAYQHDSEPKPKYNLEGFSTKELLKAKQRAAAVQEFLQKETPYATKTIKDAIRAPTLRELKETYTNTAHVGFDIPSEWMMTFKTVKWPKTYEPAYLKDINYFDAFKNTNIVDNFRKFSYYHVGTKGGDANHINNIILHLKKTDPDTYGPIPTARYVLEEKLKQGVTTTQLENDTHFDAVTEIPGWLFQDIND